LRIDDRQPGKQFINGQKISAPFFRHDHGFIEGELRRDAASLASVMSSGMIDQDAPHQLGRHAKKMAPVLPLSAPT
jgi:hypothetical protein